MQKRIVLALSTLCENPNRKTGLTTLFENLVRHSVELFPEIAWIVFVDPSYEWRVIHPQVRVVRWFSGNQHLVRRLFADHVCVPLAAKTLRASALVSVGFVPLIKLLPTVMHLLVLTHVGGDNSLGRWRQAYRKWSVKSGLRKANLIITNSSWAAEQITARWPSCRDRLIVSYEGLQHEIFNLNKIPKEEDRLRETFGLEGGYFLWVSNFYAYKQVDLLLRGYAQLDSSQRDKHPLVLVGGAWGDGAKAAKQQAEDLGILENLRFLGWVGDEWLAPLYRNAIAFCLASREETFGRSVAEAMACGTPCIVNDIPIMWEVSAGEAVIVDYRETSVLAGALLAVIGDSGLRESLSAKGPVRARAFQFSKLASERMEAIKNCLHSLDAAPCGRSGDN